MIIPIKNIEIFLQISSNIRNQILKFPKIQKLNSICLSFLSTLQQNWNYIMKTKAEQKELISLKL